MDALSLSSPPLSLNPLSAHLLTLKSPTLLSKSPTFSLRPSTSPQSFKCLPLGSRHLRKTLVARSGVMGMLFSERIVFLGHKIDDFVADLVISELLLLDAQDPTKDIKLFINSPGGSHRRISKEVLGESKGKGSISKKTLRWNDKVQAMVKAKECFKKWQKDRNEKNFQGYKQASEEAKKAVTDARLRVYEDFYARLDSKDGEKNIYKLTKLREGKARDVSQVKCIKDSDSVVLVKDE
ncbi:hypothetical protein RHMOL_Rhmol11G0082500 [Rhododendron molle]|uniref:Uncharacterized protein n=1 Tax=Rhododendron molle TaxID=49168 RepID=A0ACC0LQQ2_RHOML|nr:hypothetical protein RHMOL_Rhmol11G0082500 [Rhododendron molle]